MVSISHCKKKIHIGNYLLNEYSFNIALKKDEAFLLIVSMYVDMYVLKHVMQLQIIIFSVFIGRRWLLLFYNKYTGKLAKRGMSYIQIMGMVVGN